ncbi:hypothetical protein GCM10007962_32690 [Yeosuana aromativorans]|uniref:Uncharacterized protein n=2 Tax=Yeosuana aromativorans TaxID=288019 RepID=A0A8J3FK12_9FLAO|nr:hypothetical protein GCM10007962_32690 [Yeosuana aromativorans]
MGILVLGSFAPVLQIILVYGNVIYLYPFETIFGTDDLKVLNFINLISGILTVYGFYKAKKTGFKLIWAILTVFFFNAFLNFMWDENGGDPNPYFIGIMISGFLTTLPLVIIGFLKEKRIRK